MAVPARRPSIRLIWTASGELSGNCAVGHEAQIRSPLAMAVLIIIPALILTFIVQKHLIAGLTFGGVKG